MAMNADSHIGKCTANLRRHAGNLIGKGRTVGIAQTKRVRTCRGRRLQNLHGIFCVIFIAVIKMLCVKNNLFSPVFQKRNRGADNFQIFRTLRMQYLADVQIPCLAENGNDLRSGSKNRLKVGILLRSDSDAMCTSEGAQLCMGQLQAGGSAKKFHILRIGAGISCLDIVQTKVVERADDLDFVINRERHPLALRTVTQRGVIYKYFLILHILSSPFLK